MKKVGLVVSFLVASTFAIMGCAADSDSSSDAADPGDEQDVVSAIANARIETFEGLDGQHYFHLVAANGEIVLQSEGYKSLESAKNGIAAVLEAGSHASSFEKREAVDGESYFVLKAGNNQVIGVSETFATSTSASASLTTVKSLVRDINRESSPAPAQAKFESYKGADGLTYFTMRAGNGQTVLSSQGYTSLTGAKKGAASVKVNGVDPARFEVLEAKDGQFYLRLKAANGEVIGRSEMYVSKSNATRARDAMVDLLRRGAIR